MAISPVHGTIDAIAGENAGVADVSFLEQKQPETTALGWQFQRQQSLARGRLNHLKG